MSWRDEAACRGMDTEFFHPQHNDPSPLKICARCQVASECLEDALAVEDHYRNCRFGIRGGMTSRARQREWERRQDDAVWRVMQRTMDDKLWYYQECRAFIANLRVEGSDPQGEPETIAA